MGTSPDTNAMETGTLLQMVRQCTSPFSRKSNPRRGLRSPSVEGESSCQHPAVHKSNSLTVLYFNARSIIPKFDALCSEVEIHKPDLICITETWLSEEVSDSEIALAGYQLHRLDRNRVEVYSYMFILPSQLKSFTKDLLI